MKHLLTAGLAAAFLVGCVTAPPAPEPLAEGEEFHPTDALLIGGNGGLIHQERKLMQLIYSQKMMGLI